MQYNALQGDCFETYGEHHSLGPDDANSTSKAWVHRTRAMSCESEYSVLRRSHSEEARNPRKHNRAFIPLLRHYLLKYMFFDAVVRFIGIDTSRLWSWFYEGNLSHNTPLNLMWRKEYKIYQLIVSCLISSLKLSTS